MVATVPRNGATAIFWARSFDVGHGTAQGPDELTHFTYEDRDGKEAPGYLAPIQVAGIVLTPGGPDDKSGMRLEVPS